jgi:hypothetical protein
MKTYSEFQPTAFDPKGLGCRDMQDWLVAPCSVNRDSGPRTQSNWACQLKALGGETDDCQVHRFGHWGPGWFEIVLINPARTDLVAIADSLESFLADYPVLDDEDCSQREHDDYVESWNQCGMTRDMARVIAKAFDLKCPTLDKLEDVEPDAMRELYESLTPSGDYYETCDNGANFGNRVKYAVNRLDRDTLANHETPFPPLDSIA